MHAVAITTTSDPEVKITHEGEELSFNISRFGREHFQKPEYDVFEYINKLWNDFPLDVQKKIFNIYKEIQSVYDKSFSKNDFNDFITDKVTELIKIHDIDYILNWISFRTDIVIPPGFENTYNHSIDSNTSRDKTYTSSDYINLVALSLCMRCMIPVWGEYIKATRHETGNELKEFFALKLLGKSNIMTSKPFTKLKTYVESLTVDKHTPNNVLKGISSDDFVYWLLGLICTKRLTIADLRGTDPSSNIITYIYKFIVQKIQDRDNNFENSYKEKKFDKDSTGNQENKISTLEMYKIKSSISPGEISELEFSMQDMYNIANQLTSKIITEDLTKSLETSKQLMHYSIYETQLILLAWVFKPVISPTGIDYLPKDIIVKLLGTLESVLWARGHYYLALLATCFHVSSSSEMLISPMDSKMRMPKELSDEIEKIYPLTRPIVSRRSKTPTKTTNIVLDAIDSLTDELTMYNWKCTADESRIEKVFGNTNRKFPIKPDIKQYLGELVLEIGKGTSL